MESELTRLDSLFKFCLCIVQIGGELAIIDHVLVRLVDLTAASRASDPVNKACFICAIVQHLVFDADSTHVVRFLVLIQDKLELLTNLITHTLVERCKQALSCLVSGDNAHRVERIRFNLIKIGLVCVTRTCAILAASERSRSGNGKHSILFESNIVVVSQCAYLVHGLCIHLRQSHIGGHIKQRIVICVLLDHDLQIVAARTAVLCRSKSVACFLAAAVQTIGVQGLCFLEKITQAFHLIIGIGVAEQLHSGLLEITVSDFKNAAFIAPVQHKGHGNGATIRQRSGCRCKRYEVDVSTGQNLVLRYESTAAKCHFTHLSFL